MDHFPLLAEDDRVEWSEILLRGTDAVSFAQGQLACDVERGSGSGALLTPSSVVVGDFSFVTNAEEVVLTMRAELTDAVVAQLRRFALRVRCSFDVVNDAAGPYQTVGEQVASMLPGPAEFSRGLSPQSFGAHFVQRTVSFTKGCFTGQELVGRLDARGSSVPFRLIHFSGPSLAVVEEFLRSKGPAGDQSSAGVTTAVDRRDEVCGLGFAHRSLIEVGQADNVVKLTLV